MISKCDIGSSSTIKKIITIAPIINMSLINNTRLSIIILLNLSKYTFDIEQLIQCNQLDIECVRIGYIATLVVYEQRIILFFPNFGCDIFHIM